MRRFVCVVGTGARGTPIGWSIVQARSWQAAEEKVSDMVDRRSDDLKLRRFSVIAVGSPADQYIRRITLGQLSRLPFFGEA